MALRKVMASDGSLTLIDPFQLSRIRSINATRRAARAAVNQYRNGRVNWVEQFSTDAVRKWTDPIDLLFLDGDHAESAVWKDWKDWHTFVGQGGLVIFHDARVFPRGWPVEEDGPVRVVNALFRHGVTPGWRILEEVDSLVAVQRRE